MAEGTSPENLRKFLESDDPALVQLGLSMAKGSGVPEELLGLVAGIYMWHDDKGVRATAKSVFMKQAPDELKEILKRTWNPNYRTLIHNSNPEEPGGKILQKKVEKLIEYCKDTPLDTTDMWKHASISLHSALRAKLRKARDKRVLRDALKKLGHEVE